ncbi:heterokaryon incompatibility protein-domain-containing protein [Astrocystis sublimbata]|nr:heterokaryon incompatibility protein-domain-containing protein [Astrocystis sublimbata]
MLRLDASFTRHQLCKTCADIVQNSSILRVKSLEVDKESQAAEDEYRREKEEHAHLNFDDLASSTDKGCHLCTLLYEQYVQDNPDSINNSKDKQEPLTLKIEQEFSYMGPGVISLSLEAPDSNSYSQSSSSLSIHTGAFTPSPDDDKVKGAQFGHSTASDGWFAKMDTWLRTCRDSHLDCRVAIDANTSTSFPARLIDVGITSPPQTPTLRLRETSALPHSRPPYLTLSHCWGGASFLRLLRSNHAAFLSQLLEGALPPTFRDAVAVTRRLGYRYLWIDSLCIIQDSETDWVAESAKMGDVYRFSVLTISALWGRNPYAGLFTGCSPLGFEDCVLSVGGGNRDKNSRPVRIKGHSRRRTIEGRGGGEDSDPLLRRGWVFQERGLAPRTLFFAKGTVFWECVRCDAGEFYEEPRYPLDLAHQGVWGLKQFVYYLAKNNDNGNRQKKIQAHQFWTQLREQYRVLAFTFPTDRLVAIQGIMARVGYGDNVAGVRRDGDMFLPELLWDADRVQTSTTFRDRFAQEPDSGSESEAYIAPSWSWASVGDAWGIDNYFSTYVAQEANHNDDDDGGGSEKRGRRFVHWAAEILEVNVPTRANGQVVSGGYLKLRAPMVKITRPLDGFSSWFPDVRRESPSLAIGDKFAVLMARVFETDTSRDDGADDDGEEAQYKDFCLVLESKPGHDDTFYRAGILWQDSRVPELDSLFSSVLADCQVFNIRLE